MNWAANAGGDIDGDDGRGKAGDFEAVVRSEVLGEPEEQEPPDGVSEAFADEQGPGLAIDEKPSPRDLGKDVGGVAANVQEFLFRATVMAGRTLVGGPPDDEPDHAEAAGEDEGPLPAEMGGDPGHREGNEDGSDAGAAVEEAGGEGAFAFGEPFRDGLDGGGEVAGFAKAEEEAGDAEGERRAGEGVADGREAPQADGEGVAETNADGVNDAADSEQPHGIGGLEGNDDVAVLKLGPADLGLEQWGEEAEDLAVHVVDGVGEEKQGADAPSDAGHFCGRKDGGTFRMGSGFDGSAGLGHGQALVPASSEVGVAGETAGRLK
jgi:hypothetical protein